MVKTRRNPVKRATTKSFLNQASHQERELFERLRQWRLLLASSLEKPAYTVLSDTTLRDIATVRPQTLKQLSLLRGIGPVKLDKFGAAILKVVRGADPNQVAASNLDHLKD